jgi:uncharacterized Zn finger protein
MSGWYRRRHRWGRYVSVAERRHQADMLAQEAESNGTTFAPVEIAGRKIATTFWGKAWCDGLESHSDYANRLPRGRTYVRNGSVFDLLVEAGRVAAQVSGSEIYNVNIEIKPISKRRWTEIKKLCAGQIGSLVELLRGSISTGVMGIVTNPEHGLFPKPKEISLNCSCPDWAVMCKHVAAALYGVGARLDHSPELLFTLRGVDAAELVEVATSQPASTSPERSKTLDASELSSVFDIDLDLQGKTIDEAVVKPSTRSSTKAKRSPRGGKSKPASTKLNPERLSRLHARAIALIDTIEPLGDLIQEVQLARGRLYLWWQPGELMARITPCKPGPLLLETPRKKLWTEVKRGQLATVLRALVNSV